MKIIKSFRFGIVIGGAVSILTALVFTLWDWLENPSGIFHGPGGTNWNFVTETAISWLLPTFFVATLIATISHLLLHRIRQYATDRRRNSQQPPGDE